MQLPTNSKRLAARLLFVALVLLVYFYGAGGMPFVGPDEPRYAQVAREMFERNDWVTPTLGGETWFEKPALLYWAMMASFHLFGVSEWAARLPSALAGLLTIAAVAWLARRTRFEVEDASDEANADKNGDGEGRSENFALLCAGVAASSIGVLVFARAASFDIILTAAMAWTLALFFAADTATHEGARRRLLCGMYAACGVGLLAKGLVGVILPAIVIALYFLLNRRLPSRQMWLSLVWGAIVVALVAGLWYVPVTLKHGRAFVDEFFLQHHFARYTSNKYRHPQPFYFYLPALLALVVPWTLCLAASVGAARHWRWGARDVQSRLRVFALAWTFAPVFFFSLSGSKLPGYILPAVPGAALLVGAWLMERRKKRRDEGAENDGGDASPVLRLTGGAMALLACVGVWFATYSEEASVGASLLVAAPLVIAGLFTAHKRMSVERAVAAITCAALAATLIAAITLAGRAGRRHSSHALIEAAARADGTAFSGERLYGLYTFDRTSEFYAAGRIAYDQEGEPIVFDDMKQVIALLQRLEADGAQSDGALRPSMLIFTFPKYTHHLTGVDALDAEIIGVNPQVVLVRVQGKG